MNYQKKADKCLQEWGRRKYQRCEICGKEVSCLHHLFPKSSSSALRYEEYNLIPVCVGCHLKFHSKFSSEMVGIIVLKRGRKWFEDLGKKKHTVIKPGKKYYMSIIEKYGN
jgi:5-methylcytosine-specific restriction endonuclease McrA